MEPERAEDAPLLSPEDGFCREERSASAERRAHARGWRVRRADLALVTVLCMAASFVSVWKPTEKPVGALWRHYLKQLEAKYAKDGQMQFQYMTYDDIDEHKRETGYAVTYSPRGFVIDGKATLLLGGSIHYPRSTPRMWEDLMRKAKNDGLNHIELYIFWNVHEPTRDTFHLGGNANITNFYDIAVRLGLFLHVRFGPYACAEWNNGGLPYWLDAIPGMDVRSSSAPWMSEMRRFVKKMVEISRPYLAENGGPIIMAQIENEYNGDDNDYVAWCGDFVRELDTKIPWVMCNGKAANNTILACNGNDCVDFAETQASLRPSDPFIWTEDEGWYQTWELKADDGGDVQQDDYNRAPDEVAYAIARWFAVGGAHHNYYMYHGGNNYGRSAAAGVTTKYADGVNLHHDGLSNEPKRSHLRTLHHALIDCNEVLLENERQIHHAIPLSAPNTQAFVYGRGDNSVSFLENAGASPVDVVYDGSSYHLEPKSMLILKNKTAIFYTADVRASYPHRQMRVYTELVPAPGLKWDIWTESGDQRKVLVDKKPLEQLSVTADRTDYLTYETTFTVNDNVITKNGDLTLKFTACDANGFAIFVNDLFIEEVHRGYPGENCSVPFSVKLPSWVSSADTNKGTRRLSIVSVSLGLFSLGKNHHKGITGDVTLNDKQSLIGESKWKMYPGLMGEHLKIYDPKWMASVPWDRYERDNTTYPAMSWYRTSFILPRPPKDIRAKPVEETKSILVDCVGLTRGRVFLNGHDLGRYWLIRNTSGDYVQRYYHVPPDWLQKNPRERNSLVVFDEMGGSIRDVRVVLSTMLDDYLDPAREIVANFKSHSSAVASTERRP